MLNDSFKVRYKGIPIAISQTDTSFPVKPHNHSEIEVLYICQGACQIRVNGRQFTAGEGDLVFVDPLEVHSITIDRSRPHRHRCICFDPSIIPDAAVAQGIREGTVRLPAFIAGDSAHNAYLSARFAELYAAVEADGKTLAMEGTALVSLMMAYLIRNGLLSANTAERKNTAFCDKVLHYISDNYSSPITSDHAARALSFDQSYFCRKFRKNFGMDFSSYLSMYRIAASKKLMEDGRSSIADVAFACGFSCPDHFTRCFRKLVGMLPSEYKKGQYRSENQSTG